MQGTGVWSLFGELKSHMHHSAAKKKRDKPKDEGLWGWRDWGVVTRLWVSAMSKGKKFQEMIQMGVTGIGPRAHQASVGRIEDPQKDVNNWRSQSRPRNQIFSERGGAMRKLVDNSN